MNRSRMFRVGIALASVAAMGLSACGSDDGDSTDNNSSGSTSTSKSKKSSATSTTKEKPKGSSPKNPVEMEGSEIDLSNGPTVSISNVRTNVTVKETPPGVAVELCPSDHTYPLAMDVKITNNTPDSGDIPFIRSMVSLVDRDHMDQELMMPTIGGRCSDIDPSSFVMQDSQGMSLPYGEEFKSVYTDHYSGITADRVGALAFTMPGEPDLITTVGDLPLGDNAN